MQHNLGTYNNLKEVWNRYPNGGGHGDYVIIDGEKLYWNELQTSWGDYEYEPEIIRPGIVYEGDIKVEGTGTFHEGIKIGDSIPGYSGALIDEFGNADYRRVNTDSLFIRDEESGNLVSLAKYIVRFKTELPPNWAEYQKLPLFGSARLLLFDGTSESRYYTTIRDVTDAIAAHIEVTGGGGGGGSSIVVIRSDDQTVAPSDSNVYSSLATLRQIDLALQFATGVFLSRLHSDTASGHISFLQGITVEELATLTQGLKIGDYQKGLLGTGGSIDQHGHAELTSLTLRRFLEVPELRYNKVQVYTGIRWNTFGAGIISEIEIDKDAEGNELQSGTITLKLEDGEFGAIAVDDLCQGIFHNFNGANDAVSEDQKNGNFKFAGFSTSYFRITEILDGSNSQFRYVLRGVSEQWTQQNHPKPFMHFACYANPSNPDRQSSTYTTTDYTIRLKNMTTWEYGADNIYEISGKLDGFTIGETVLEGEGQAFGNAYIWGTLQKVYNDPVRMEINNGGDGFLALGENMTITCKVMRGWEDITDTVETWTVTRETGSQTEDTAWNIAHTNFNGTLEITHTKQYTDLGSGLSTLFVFTAKTGDNIASFHLTI